MIRKNRRYTQLGRKIAGLAKTQAELSTILGLTQQSVSGKLRGRIAITLRDLETLSGHYDVPMLYFLTPEEVSLDKVRTLELFLAAPTNVSELLEIASAMPKSITSQLVKVAHALDQALKSNALDARQTQGSFEVEAAMRRHVLNDQTKPLSD